MTTLKELEAYKTLDDIPMAVIRELIGSYCNRGIETDIETVDNEKLFKNMAWLVWRAIKRLPSAWFVDPSNMTIRVDRMATGINKIRIVDLNLNTKYTIEIGTEEDKKNGFEEMHHILRDEQGNEMHCDLTWPNFAKYFKKKPEEKAIAEAAHPTK